MFQRVSNKMKKHFSLSRVKTFLDRYTVIRVLGSGATSIVYKVMDNSSYECYTCKQINNRNHSARREICILRKLPKDCCFPQIKETIEENNQISILTNYIHGRELFRWFDDTLDSKEKFLDEDIIRKIFEQMVIITKKLHDKEFVHLDIKLENFIISKDPNITLSMIDFGSCHSYPKGEQFISTLVGTKGYSPYEVYRGKYHSTTDVWSLGVCLWLLLARCPAFDHCDFSFSNISTITRDDFLFPTRIHHKNKHKLSDNAFNLICKMLITNPEDRISIVDVLKHPWMTYGKEENNLPV